MSQITFFGTEDFSAMTLNHLLDCGFDIEVVVTKPDSKRGRGRKITQPLVKQIALENNIPVLQPRSINDLPGMLSNTKKDIGILVSFGKIIPQSIIELFQHGIINLHPSILPKYRGASPIESAILNGDSETGVSIMLLDKEMDAGPIFATKKVRLNQTETAPELYNQLGNLGAKLMADTIPKILHLDIKPKIQKHEDATFSKLLKKSDGLLDPSSKTAKQLERQIRAHLQYPKSTLELNNDKIIVTKAHVGIHKEHGLSIQAQDGSFLTIDELVNKNGNRITALDYINHLRSS